MAIYAVKQQGNDQLRLVKAKNKTQAIGFVARNSFSAEALSGEEVATHMMANKLVQVEDADTQQPGGAE